MTTKLSDEIGNESGRNIKKNAMSSMALSDGEKDFYNSVPVFGTSQEELNKMNSLGDYETSAISFGDNIFMREKFPYNPSLTFGNIQHLPMWLTDKDTLAHEMGHQIASRSRIPDTELNAELYKDEVAGRLSDKPDRVSALAPHILRALEKTNYIIPDNFIGKRESQMLRDRRIK